MKSAPIFPGDRTLMDIEYKYRSHKILGFISMQVVESTLPDIPYLYCYPANYYNVSICPFLSTLVIGYVSECNEIKNHNRMRQSDPALDKYWVKQNGYFRLATTV